MIVTRAGRFLREMAGILALLGGLAAGAAATPDDAGSALRYWSQPQTGLAIGGYDPVAYFTSGAARPGRAAFEAGHASTVWRFANEGNRAAFVADPDVYAPAFGGYSPVAVARGIAVTGDPLIWVIHEDRLYLFHSPVHKRLWQQDRADMLARARARWPALRARLPR